MAARDQADFMGYVAIAWPSVIAAYLRAAFDQARQPKTS